MTISCHFSRERLDIQRNASPVASRDTLVRNKLIVTTVASNVSRGRLSKVFTTDHRSLICISQFPITLCVDELHIATDLSGRGV